MKIFHLHIICLLLVLLPARLWSQQEISIDEMPVEFFGNWMDRNGGSTWRLETKREYLGANNFAWRYRRIVVEDGVYTIDVEYSPPVLQSSDPSSSKWKPNDPNNGSVQRFIFSNIQSGSMTIDDKYANRWYQGIRKTETQYFKKIQPSALPGKYMGTWLASGGSFPEEMTVSTKGVEVNGTDWKYFEIMKDGSNYRIVLQHENQFHVWVPQMKGLDRLNSMYYPYSNLNRKTAYRDIQNGNQQASKVIKASEMPKEIFGNWEDEGGLWQYQIKPGYFGVDNKLWTYKRVSVKNGTYSLEVQDDRGATKQYSFRILSKERIQALDAYRGYEYELTSKSFGNRFYKLSPQEIPDRYFGYWASTYGNEVEVFMNQESITVNGEPWKYHEIIVNGGEHRFTLERNGRYHLWIPKSFGSTGMTSVFDGNVKLKLQRRLSESELKGKSATSIPETDIELKYEEASPSDEPDSLSQQTPIAVLPNAVYRNWNSRSGEWVFDIQKTHMSMEQNAWQYDQIREENQTYFLDLSRYDMEGNKIATQELSLRLISDIWMEVGQDGIRYEVLAMPFNDSFYLIHADDLPNTLLGDWYHTSGVDSLALQIQSDGFQWRGRPMSYKQIIHKNDDYYLTGQNGNTFRIFRMEQMEDGYLQVALEGQTYLFSRQPILPSLGRMLLIVLAVLLIGSGLAWLFFRWRTKNLQRKELAKRREIELELKALRSQMNPHFLFNSLNSIQNLINKQDPDQANHYLSRFSSLMRKVLNNTESAFITIEEEISILSLYCELEALRFQFDFHITVAPEIDVYNTEIPGMLIQPFVENAILHGIGPSDTKGELNILFQKEGELISCVVDDNGIGIQASLAQKKQPVQNNPSYGIRLAEDRLEMIHAHYGEELRIEIFDKSEKNSSETGTRIQMYLPTNLS